MSARKDLNKLTIPFIVLVVLLLVESYALYYYKTKMEKAIESFEVLQQQIPFEREKLIKEIEGFHISDSLKKEAENFVNDKGIKLLGRFKTKTEDGIYE